MLLSLAAAIVLSLAPPLTSGAPAAPPDLLAVNYPAKGGSVVQFAGPGTVTWLQPVKLGAEARDVFDNTFLSQGYYGAWAMAPGGGYGYASGTGSIEAANEIALAQCYSTNSSCEIVAVLQPADFVAPGPGTFTLSEAMTTEFNLPDRGPFRAMAVSEDGAYAVVWGHASQGEADAAARSDCASQLLQLDLDLRAMPCILLPGY